jgi:uncharacterized surface protein with fasciclin (FAS1) repeats
MRNRYSIFILLALFTAFLVGCDSEPEVSVGPRPDYSVLQILELNGYTSFVTAVKHAGLQNQIESATNQTIFAPNNSAFTVLLTQLDVDRIEQIDPATLASVLQYHVSVEGGFASADLPRRIAAGGANLYVTGPTASKSVNGKSTIVLPNRSGSNGIFHGINLVLTPPTNTIFAEITARAQAAAPQFTLLKHALEITDLDVTLSSGDFTLFAPTDAAFTTAGLGTTAALDALPTATLTAILLNHVLPSAQFSVDLVTSRIATAAGPVAGAVKGIDVNATTLTVEGATIQVPNQLRTNGVLHQVSALIRTKVAQKEGMTVTGVALGPIVGAAGNLAIETQSDNFGLLISAASYTKLDEINREQKYSIYLPRTPRSVASFSGDNAAIVDYIERHIFSSSVDIPALANGTKVTSIGGDEYFVAVGLEGTTNVRYINGEVASRGTFAAIGFPADQGARKTVYDGFVYSHGGTGYSGFTPLPEETIVELMANSSNLTLIAAAIKAAGKTTAVSAQGVTFFAIDDVAFEDLTGLSTVAEIDALDPTDDAALIEELVQIIDKHTVKSIQFGVTITSTLPKLKNSLDEEMVIALVQGEVVVIDNLSRPDTRFTDFTTFNAIIGNNGVVHIVDKVFEF